MIKSLQWLLLGLAVPSLYLTEHSNILLMSMSLNASTVWYHSKKFQNLEKMTFLKVYPSRIPFLIMIPSIC